MGAAGQVEIGAPEEGREDQEAEHGQSRRIMSGPSLHGDCGGSWGAGVQCPARGWLEGAAFEAVPKLGAGQEARIVRL